MTIEHIAIIGAGQMGNGIAQVSSCAGYKVTMIDIKQEFVEKGMSAIEKSLNKLVSKEKPRFIQRGFISYDQSQ